MDMLAEHESTGGGADHAAVVEELYGVRARSWADRILTDIDLGAVLPEFIRQGVCLSCGGAVLKGEHLDPDRHQQYKYPRSEEEI